MQAEENYVSLKRRHEKLKKSLLRQAHRGKVQRVHKDKFMPGCSHDTTEARNAAIEHFNQPSSILQQAVVASSHVPSTSHCPPAAAGTRSVDTTFANIPMALPPPPVLAESFSAWELWVGQLDEMLSHEHDEAKDKANAAMFNSMCNLFERSDPAILNSSPGTTFFGPRATQATSTLVMPLPEPDVDVASWLENAPPLPDSACTREETEIDVLQIECSVLRQHLAAYVMAPILEHRKWEDHYEVSPSRRSHVNYSTRSATEMRPEMDVPLLRLFRP